MVALTKMLKFYVRGFKTLYFLNSLMDLLYIWYDNRCWSKILFSTVHTPAYDPEVKVKVTDLQICINKNVSFKSKFLGPYIFRWIYFIFSMIINVGPKFYLSTALLMTLRSRSWTSKYALTKMFKFYFKVFKTLYFLNPWMDLLYIW